MSNAGVSDGMAAMELRAAVEGVQVGIDFVKDRLWATTGATKDRNPELDATLDAALLNLVTAKALIKSMGEDR